jgi:hypothetical protein
MPSIVTLDIYSGRENPTWVIDDQQISELRRQSARATGPRQGPLPLLGYRGFHVRPVESEHVPALRLEGHAESVAGAGDAVVVASPAAEEFLLSTAGKSISAAVKKHVKDAIARGISPDLLRALAHALAHRCPACLAADAPVYNPNFWNVPARQPFNNCYNYANDQATNTFAQPGRATGKPITALSCPGVQPSAVSDGLKACPNFARKLGKGQGWYVALVIWPGVDYHWYRQDTVGCWSHKPGHTQARNTDNQGKAIADPKTCDRGPYVKFCTYMITNRKVRIR